MYKFAHKLLSEIMADMDAGNKIDASKLYTFNKLIPMFTKAKAYEDVVCKPEKPEQKGLSADVIAKIEQVSGKKYGDEKFGNARGVRNYFDSVVTAQATRILKLENPSEEEFRTILPEDLV